MQIPCRRIAKVNLFNMVHVCYCDARIVTSSCKGGQKSPFRQWSPEIDAEFLYKAKTLGYLIGLCKQPLNVTGAYLNTPTKIRAIIDANAI